MSCDVSRWGLAAGSPGHLEEVGGGERLRGSGFGSRRLRARTFWTGCRKARGAQPRSGPLELELSSRMAAQVASEGAAGGARRRKRRPRPAPSGIVWAAP